MTFLSNIKKYLNFKTPPFSRIDRKISAYLSIYNDWDILKEALASIRPYIDELVVVDGAYDWMEPLIIAMGGNPSKSKEEVYQVIENCGIPYKVISRTWSNELEKRMVGYDSCSHRYRFRVDADEVYFFKEESFEEFFKTGAAVAEMEMPFYMNPGWIVNRTDMSTLPAQGFLFDSEKISSDIHLNYLWLVLTADDLPTAGQFPYPIFGKPIAFNAHLTNWRTPKTSINRGAFYVMNWMRKNGVPWVPELSGRPLNSFKSLFNIINPKQFFDALLYGAFPVSLYDPKSNESLINSPLNKEQQSSIEHLFEKFKQELSILYKDLYLNKHYMMANEEVYFDISFPLTIDALSSNNAINIEFSSDPIDLKVELLILSTTQPNYYRISAPYILLGSNLNIDLSAIQVPTEYLRRVIAISCGTHPPQPLIEYQFIK